DPERALKLLGHAAQGIAGGDEIQMLGVDSQHRRVGAGAGGGGEGIVVGGVEAGDVVGLHLALVGPAALGDAAQEHVGGGAQLDEQVGQGNLLGQGGVEAVVEAHVVAAQVDA